tara:strand:- start:382 stop:621 length:240 start_codon:yes stop_codon:yes gene_type:complete
MKNYIKDKFKNSSLILSIIYTIGHIIIAMQCNYFITGTKIELAAIDALIEPMINGVWFYLLHKIYKYYNHSISNEIVSN